MMYPLKNWNNLRRGYEFGDKTFYNDFHIGLDLFVPVGTPIYAPEDGYATKKITNIIGNAIYFEGSKFQRFLHLSKYGKLGKVKEGDIMGYTGNTGQSTGPHLHSDVSKGELDLANYKTSFIDPEKFYKQSEEPVIKYGMLRTIKGEKEDAVYIVGEKQIYHIITFPTYVDGIDDSLWGPCEILPQEEVDAMEKGQPISFIY